MLQPISEIESRPVNWLLPGQERTESKLTALRESVLRGAPYGDEQ